jgi:hypothetical protein
MTGRSTQTLDLTTLVPMLSLDSPEWKNLRHAYGSANDIPALLQQLRDLPSSEGDTEPWFTLWSALAHQGDVYSASFAAVPYVVEFLAQDPQRADHSYFQFPAWVEICRAKNGIDVPAELAQTYTAALARLPGLVAVAASRRLDPALLACALSALAAANGQPEMAEAALELSSPEAASEFLEWTLSR